MSAESAAPISPARKRDVQLATWRRAIQVMPGGTDSNFRAWGEATIYVDHGKGGTVWDLDGNAYVDLRMGYTARPSWATPTTGWTTMSTSGCGRG